MGLAEKVGSGMGMLPAKIDATRSDLRERFNADPYASHNEELALTLGRMRSDDELPRLVLVATGPGQWLVAATGPRRGDDLHEVGSPVFHDRVDAERFAFDLRWTWLAERDADA